MKSLYSFLISFILLPLHAFSQPYHDAVAFGLKGPVKKCVITEGARDIPLDFTEISFNRDGSLSSWSVAEEKTFKVSRNSNGFISELTSSEVTGLFLFSRTDKYSFTYTNNSLYRKEVEQFGNKYSYIFSFEENNMISIRSSKRMTTDKRDPMTKFFNPQSDHEYDIETQYRINKVDKYGNITDLDEVRFNKSLNKYVVQCNIKLNISYWDVKSNNEDIQSETVNSSVDIPSPKSVTIKDLISYPFGIYISHNDNIWAPKTKDIVNTFATKTNWKLERYSDYEYRIYETTNYSYNGIPVKVASMNMDLGANFAEFYEYYFYKNITGIVPKNESRSNFSSLPHWNLQEATEFYNSIVNDLTSLGIKINPVESKKDSRLSNGFDDTSYYEVTLQKSVNKYSSFISVTLTVAKRCSRRDKSNVQ